MTEAENSETWSPEALRLSITRDLRDIVRLYGSLPDEAAHNPSSSLFPGGEALNLAAPAASLTAWEFQYETIDGREYKTEAAHQRAIGYAEDQVGEFHPRLLLSEWEDQLRYAHGQRTDLDSTVPSAAKYIAGKIDWMIQPDHNNRPTFGPVGQMARDLRTCVTQMENTTKDGTRAEFARVTCIAESCESKPRLMKFWTAQVRWDHYKCPACGATYTPQQFINARRQNMHSRGAARFLMPSEAATASEVPLKTLVSWMARRNVASAFEMPTGRRLVWWPDVRERATQRAMRLKRQAARRAEQQRKAQEQANGNADPAQPEATGNDTRRAS
ncbi:hypothetical protein HMPREF0063_10068 [Aeromicrobium marinum DSM 15272]|uniref:Uncharacterized protein n=1 Tax=Aeromicrobium marinum DSM 15272 TaxID=585531 RepID=E2S7R1_9ACTN|nr:hypothetical protein [Aeromicrobium marinum]EFQ84727.1 hypothetical protein HMPREF0063_10068 [Aeromicrobium marinum DSM 15272]